MKNSFVLTDEIIDSLDVVELRALAKSGKLLVMINSLMEMKMSALPKRSDYEHLTGEIHLSAAARKYDLSKTTIAQWIKDGLLKYTGSDKNRKLMMERDIAYLSARFKALGGSQGKKVLN
jgi:hypothetical protein